MAQQNVVELGSGMRECINNCLETRRLALEALNHVLRNERGFEAALRLQDCADLCQTSADLMLRDSPLHTRTCAACAEACEAAIKAVEDVGDKRLDTFVGAARKCADTCRGMASQTTAKRQP